MAKTRTFIAVEAVDEVYSRAQDAIDELRAVASHVKWVAADNLHWTLQFLGDLNDEEIAEVCLRVSRICAEVEPFTVEALGVGAFPSIERPRVLWIGARDGNDAFRQLQSAIDDSLAKLGFRSEQRQFVPHLTLGRVCPGNNAALTQKLAELTEFSAGWMSVDEVIVFASELNRQGPKYMPLAHCPLAGV